MKKSIHFIPSSLVCSVAIDLTVEDGVIREVCFEGGCSGNLQGISMLVRGMMHSSIIACNDTVNSCAILFLFLLIAVLRTYLPYHNNYTTSP